jgi:multidrug efflux system outer membrane protein
MKTSTFTFIILFLFHSGSGGLLHAESPGQWKGPTGGAMSLASVESANWWALFEDRQLQQLIGSLDLATPQLAAAVQRVEQARAGVNRVRSELFPTLTATAGGGRSQTSFATAAFVPVRYANQWDAAVVASYEVDLWGRIRNGVRSARAAMLADEAAVEALRLSLRAELTDAYLTMRGLEAETGIVEQALVTRRKNLALTQKLKDAGAVSDLEVEQARTDLLAAEVEASALKQGRMELENAIALVAGRDASGFRLPTTGRLPASPVVPKVLPSELLLRRPDVAVAACRMDAAAAQVKVARTAWYPTLHLEARTGVSAESVSRMDEDAARAGSIGFTFSLPLFDGGRRRAALDAAKAAQMESIEQQRHIILAAAADAETALGKVFWGRQQVEQSSAAATAAERSASLIGEKYAAGKVDTFQVLLAERLRLDAARMKVRSQTTSLRAVVALVRALGGGWSR